MQEELLKIMVVDDEPLAQLRLKGMIESSEGCELIALASNGNEAIDMAEQTQPDIILMDIRMPGMDGLEAAAIITESNCPPAIVFCTAYDDHALAAFEANATAYLLKPIKKSELERAIDQCKTVNRAQQISFDEDAYIVSQSLKGNEKIRVKDIRALVADSKYVSAYLKDREVILDSSLKKLESEFPHFIRVHRNALIAPQYLLAVEKKKVSQLEDTHMRESLVVRLDGTDLCPEVSRRHMAEIRKLLKS